MAEEYLQTIWFKSELNTRTGAWTLKTESRHSTNPAVVDSGWSQQGCHLTNRAAKDDTAGSMGIPGFQWRKFKDEFSHKLHL